MGRINRNKINSGIACNKITRILVIYVLLLAFILTSYMTVSAVSIPAAKPIDHTCTGDQATDIVEIALSQDGYTGVYSGGKKYSAYGKWYHNSSTASGAWCAMFVSWCAYKAGISTSIVPKTSISNDYKTSGKGIYHAKGYRPKKGDLVLYHYPSGADRPVNHVGIVREDAFYEGDVLVVRTIEGNVLNSDTGNKGKVARLARRSNTPNNNYKYIVGYITPKYNTIVTYNANGGSGAPAKQIKSYGKAITLSSNKPTRTGYTFQGWATSASASTPSYYPGSSYSGNTKLALYACWKRNTATIRYYANGGYNAPASQTKSYGVGMYLSSTAPWRDGYSFKGWSTNSNASTALYSSGAWFSDDSALKSYSGAVINMYAVWQKNQKPSNNNNSGNEGYYNGTSNSGTNAGDGYQNNGNAVNNSSNNNNRSVVVRSAKASAGAYIKGTRLTKVKKGKRKATIKWKKVKRIGGYQIQYSTKRNFSSDTEIKTVKGCGKTKTTIKKLKAKKQYYVRIRTFRIIGSRTEYSGWSKARKIKIR